METPVTITGVGSTLLGVATRAESARETAVLIVPAPGGSRTGPDRLHVRLAREFALAGFASLRFDPPDGGDSAPSTEAAVRFDDDIAAGARRLLALHPDAFVAVLGIGRGATAAAHAWHSLADSDFPLSVLCLVDPDIPAIQGTPRKGWWRRLFGPHDDALNDDPSPTPGSGVAQPPASETRMWRELASDVLAARARLLVAARNDSTTDATLTALVGSDPAWRRAQRRSGGWHTLRDCDSSLAQPLAWRELTDWLMRRLER